MASTDHNKDWAELAREQSHPEPQDTTGEKVVEKDIEQEREGTSSAAEGTMGGATNGLSPFPEPPPKK